MVYKQYTIQYTALPQRRHQNQFRVALRFLLPAALIMVAFFTVVDFSSAGHSFGSWGFEPSYIYKCPNTSVHCPPSTVQRFIRPYAHNKIIGPGLYHIAFMGFPGSSPT